MMKVLLTATVQSHICQFHRPLVHMLHEHGCEVHVAACNNLAEKNGLKLDFADKVFDVPFDRSPKSTRNIHAYRVLKRIIEQGDYDVVHCNTPVAGVLTRMATKSLYGPRDFMIPSILSNRNKEIDDSSHRVFYTAHGFHFYQGAPRRNWMVYFPIERLFAMQTDKLITVNREDYAMANKNFRCEVEYIHGVGVDANRFRPATPEERAQRRAELGFAPGQPVLLCVGELLPNKNQQMAVRMMAEVVKEHPYAFLLIAGNGPEKENLERLIAELALENNVFLTGYLTNLEQYQQCADVLVACSHREGLPLNLVEAMLSGVPVVATDNRGHRDLIGGTSPDNTAAHAGFLVPRNDAAVMAQAVNTILKGGTCVDQMKHTARTHAEDYINSTVEAELEHIYEFGE